MFTNLHELEAQAREKLPPDLSAYIAGGAADEWTLRGNQAAHSRWRFWPRVLVDLSRRAVPTTILGEHFFFAVLAAPTACHRLAHPEGEMATARGEGQAGTCYLANTLATTSLEDATALAGLRRF